MKKTISIQIFLVFIFIISQEIKSQVQYISSYKTPYKYYTSQSEPDPGWFLPGYNDSSWPSDTGKIGYGDSDNDINVDPKNQSLYLRYDFNLSDKGTFKIMSFLADYDDGYIAYLNGKEIVRVNVDEKLKYPAYNDLSNRSHDREMTQQNPVLAWYIDSTILDTCLVTGKNIIAVQVLNDSIGGSDIHFKLDVFDITKNYYTIYTNYYRYKRQIDLDSTKLPIVLIETDEYGIKYKRIETIAHMGIIQGSEGNYNKPSDSCNIYYGPVEIEVRGESSSAFPKRSYDFELQDSYGIDTNVALLGMPRENDWILQGPWADKSQFRNAMIYELARRTGHWAARTRFCEVILNGQYVGLYTLMEKIKKDNNRIDIATLNPDEISGDDLTGGYIFKHDKPNSSVIQISYPSESNLQPGQETYIKGYYSKYKGVLKSNKGLDPTEGYRKYIDGSTLIDYVIITEFAKNCDSYAMSSYMYKDKDDNDPRIKFGPIWDYDLAFGNSPWQEGDLFEGWQFEYSINHWFEIKRLFEDTVLVNQFKSRWIELHDAFLNTTSVIAMIDSLVNVLAEPIARNYQVWPVIDKYVFQSFWPFNVSTYEEEISYMKTWLTQRVNWINNNIADLYYPVTVYPSGIEPQTNNISIANLHAFPNPFYRELKINISLPCNGNLKIQIINIDGQVVSNFIDNYMIQGEYQFTWSENSNLPAGIYILEASVDNKYIGHLKLVKAN